MVSAAPPREARSEWFRRREIWWPTWRVWSIVALVAVASCLTIFFKAYPFLAVNAPILRSTFVLEGWLGKTAIPSAVAAFRKGGYIACYTTGGPLDEDADLTGYGTYAEVGAFRLHEQGVPEAIAVPGAYTAKDRTYTSALDLRHWLRAHGGVPREITVFTHGVHARRSRLLFQKAFGDEAQIGVIATPPRNYDAARWYTSSAGVREVLGEAIAYLYARFLFWRTDS